MYNSYLTGAMEMILRCQITHKNSVPSSDLSEEYEPWSSFGAHPFCPPQVITPEDTPAAGKSVHVLTGIPLVCSSPIEVCATQPCLSSIVETTLGFQAPALKTFGLSCESELAFKQPSQAGIRMIVLTPVDPVEFTRSPPRDHVHTHVHAVVDSDPLVPSSTHAYGRKAASPQDTDAGELNMVLSSPESSSGTFEEQGQSGEDSDVIGSYGSGRQNVSSVARVHAHTLAKRPSRSKNKKTKNVQGKLKKGSKACPKGNLPVGKRDLTRLDQMRGSNDDFHEVATNLNIPPEWIGKGQKLIRAYVRTTTKAQHSNVLAAAALYLVLKQLLKNLPEYEVSKYWPQGSAQCTHLQVAAFMGVSKSCTQRTSNGMKKVMKKAFQLL